MADLIEPSDCGVNTIVDDGRSSNSCGSYVTSFNGGASNSTNSGNVSFNNSANNSGNNSGNVSNAFNVSNSGNNSDSSVISQSASAGNGSDNIGNTATNIAVVIQENIGVATQSDTSSGPGGTNPVTVIVDGTNFDGSQVSDPPGTVISITTGNLNVPTDPQFATTGDPNATASQPPYTTSGVDILQGGKAEDLFFVDATSRDGWDEIDNMHTGDIATIPGFQVGQSTLTWANGTDPDGQTGATAAVSLGGNGKIDAQITFAGVNVNTAQHWTESNYGVNDVPYLSLISGG